MEHSANGSSYNQYDHLIKLSCFFLIIFADDENWHFQSLKKLVFASNCKLKFQKIIC